MVAAAVILPLVPSTCCQNLSSSSQSCSSMLSTGLFYRPRIHRAQFSVFSVLSSPSQVNQSANFVEKSKKGNLVPLSQCIFSDHLTPVLAYRCLVNENDHEAPSFLFESVETGLHTANFGRYSIVGANPAMEIIAKENLVTTINHREGWKREELSEDPLIIPQRITDKWSPQCMDELPQQVFCGGWVGYFSYDTVRYTDKRLTFASAPADDRNLPDVHLGLYDDVLVFDHVEKKIHAIHWVQLDKFSSIEDALDNGTKRLDSLLSKIHNIVNPRLSSGSIELNAQRLRTQLEVSRMTSEAYKTAMLKAKEKMLTGSDTCQVVLSQRFERRTFSDPFEVYRVLSVVEPNPFMAYIQVRGCIFVASSPHILTYVDKHGKFTNQTLSGTERLSETYNEDAPLSKQFINGQKHFGEHNRVADWSTQEYSTCWEALKSALPSEAFTGAPKIEAMQLIDKLELNRRGPYGGSFGCISFSKNMDIADLASKTIVFPTGKAYDTLYSYKNLNKRREWVAHLQTGATIRVDSGHGDEQGHCEREAAAVARAIDLAESSFL
ncbi:anthranilate synthase alpha subunit 2, chloroplastic isoform X2 [Beta vulgaris subsp. vulgaris]|uniref:anthranilate synthase alpha subunit 2, chloroplastic isoform X2 n=1 Tax=Beta vulgaris subsp. vulgaris TaxID=3555 RepID=UPI00203685D1|nr:anthranilate synthase alpha subunit 2, chloroplastic isoform X2 [Beta vulgaris subsp. vulgaris]